MITTIQLQELLLKSFPYQPTESQSMFFMRFAAFVFDKNASQIFILKGYAGTGKTSLVKSIVTTFPNLKAKVVLLAPTGRAAKVLSNYTKKQAYTIHKKIYYRKVIDGTGYFQLQPNLHADTLFIVDEASMIGDTGSIVGSSGLLDDLVSYIFSGQNCKLMFIGDTAQLPPVGLQISNALNKQFLKSAYIHEVEEVELKYVLRQALDSGILYNAFMLRNVINSSDVQSMKKFKFKLFKDVLRLNGSDLEDTLNASYDNYGVEETIIICRSNKRAVAFNQQIRARIRWQENTISAGDYLMVVKNNYYWLTENAKGGFIANGDTLQILKVGKEYQLYGFTFVDVKIKLTDYDDEPELDVKLLLDVLTSEQPSLTMQDSKQLFDAVSEDYMHITNKHERLKKIKENEFLNALQVKFAYAITCHKAQGGQWSNVFIDQGYLTQEMMDKSFYRWLYTAITRATQQVYLINFNEQLFN